jgi:RTX calcium-binding nonapeptide repeat (4 copies)
MRVLILTALLALIAAPAARAASVESTGTIGPQASGYTVYYAAKGERNRVHVLFRGGRMTIVDRGARQIRIESGIDDPQCRHTGRQRVVCDGEPIEFYLGAGDDRIDFAPGRDSADIDHRKPLTVAEPFQDDEGEIYYDVYVDGGAGDDRIQGSSYADWVDPGAGRDRVDLRSGADDVFLGPHDGADRIRVGGGVDALYLGGRSSHGGATVDLGAGRLRWRGQTDRIAGFERATGSPAADTLIGTNRTDALYGGPGRDRLDGRGGNDLLAGDGLYQKRAYANRLIGGGGNDILDARGLSSGGRSTVDCGAGRDVEAGEVDDLLAPGCESVAFMRPSAGENESQNVDPTETMPAQPVGRSPDGSPVFSVPCAKYQENCEGKLVLERPPGGGSPPRYGEGSFKLKGGERADVTAELTDAGRAALGSGAPVGIRVTRTSGDDFGWQEVLAP